MKTDPLLSTEVGFVILFFLQNMFGFNFQKYFGIDGKDFLLLAIYVHLWRTTC